MPSFTDSKGGSWTIDITVGAIRRVKTKLGDDVNLADLKRGDVPLLTRLATDVELLVDVIHTLVEPQCDKLDVSPVDFAEALGGQAIIDAHDALYEGLSDFFQSLRQTGMVAALRRQREIIQAEMDLQAEKIQAFPLETAREKLGAAMDRATAEALERLTSIGTASASSSPPSAA